MDQINVVWASYHEDALHKGYWDNGLLMDIFKQLPVVEFEHVSEVPEGEGAVFIINGRMHVEDTAAINEDIAHLPWVLFIDTGDEEASFPWREIRHPIMRVWMMLPRMNIHDDTHFKLPNGYRPDTHETLKAIGIEERVNDWFFAGQVNHDRREQCVDELKRFQEGSYPNGVLVQTSGFGQEILPYSNYLYEMARSKIVLCPSGVESPDNFRLYEALEAGCIPVVDAFSSRHKHPGFWRYLFGADMPFPVVEYWDELPALMPTLLADWPHNASKIQAWWQQYKRKLKYQLLDDVKELSK